MQSAFYISHPELVYTVLYTAEEMCTPERTVFTSTRIERHPVETTSDLQYTLGVEWIHIPVVAFYYIHRCIDIQMTK